MANIAQAPASKNQQDVRRVCSNCIHLLCDARNHNCLAYTGTSRSVEMRMLRDGQTNDCDEFSPKQIQT